MGGRGTYAAGNNVAFSYESIGTIAGVKILRKLDGVQKLPEEAHSSRAYLLMTEDGVFKQYREYGADHQVVLEIAYHPERRLSGHRRPILHAHDYSDGFTYRSKARMLTDDEMKRYSKFFRGVDY